MTKKVQITLELDTEFVKLLNANVQLSGDCKKDQLEPKAVLGVLALMEAKGATVEQINETIPAEWKSHVRALHDKRQVLES